MQPADYLVHLSNVLMLVSYSVRDILWLRWFAVAAALTVIPYYVAQPVVLWPPVFWGSVFMAINLWQIARIYLVDHGPSCSLQRSKRSTAWASERCGRGNSPLSSPPANGGMRQRVRSLIEEGNAVEAICIAISGTADIRRQGTTIGKLAPGNVIGTALALAGEPSPIEARFAEQARYIHWPLGDLRARSWTGARICASRCSDSSIRTSRIRSNAWR